ncbi:hypothetical protein [Skermanella pratensis]|uniref:hypothetical protein n=1 Tax=Skermanella pratensis TaxID=2233999 RepID=UPI0017888D50|nr:hypothetical protein [Skermanella pratensis]
MDNGTDSHGPYLSQQDATADAIEAAEQVSGRKKPAAVLVKLPGSNATLVWTSRRRLEDRTPEDRTPEDRTPEDRTPEDRTREAVAEAGPEVRAIP